MMSKSSKVFLNIAIGAATSGSVQSDSVIHVAHKQSARVGPLKSVISVEIC